MRSVLLVSSLACVSLLLLAAHGCTEDDPDYCDDSKPCDTGRVCNKEERTCYPLGTDLSMSMDGGKEDLTVLGCSDSVECPAATPVCSNKKCGPCTAMGDAGTASECSMFHKATPFCSPGGACVQCLTRDDCAATQQTCDTKTFACAACSKNDDCSSGLCRDGKCAKPSDVWYVDNRGKPPADCKVENPGADGKSPATAFCDITDALGAMGGQRPYVLVAASKETYGPLTITGANGAQVAIIASVRLGVILQARDDKAVIRVSGTGNSVNLSIEGLRVLSSLISAGAVDCKAGPQPVSLTIRNSELSGGGRATLHSDGCTVVVDASLINLGLTGGIVLDGKDSYLITNSFIYNNGLGGTGVGVSLGQNASGSFAFNTVAGNGGPDGITGGIICLGRNQSVESSIVFRNAKKNLSQLNGCTLLDVVTGADMAAGADQSDPSITACMDPLAMNLPYCVTAMSRAVNLLPVTGDGGLVNQDGGSRTLVDHDYFGARRPQGAGYDVGAQEQ